MRSELPSLSLPGSEPPHRYRTRRPVVLGLAPSHRRTRIFRRRSRLASATLRQFSDPDVAALTDTSPFRDRITVSPGSARFHVQSPPGRPLSREGSPPPSVQRASG